MEPLTARLWAKQDQHQGDRLRLFTVLAGAVEATTVLYPGSFVDIAPSFVFRSVIYVDSDRRAARFFADSEGVEELVAANKTDDGDRSIAFMDADYRTDLGLVEQSFDLGVSLYAGFVSERCTRYLQVGGSLHGESQPRRCGDGLHGRPL